MNVVLKNVVKVTSVAVMLALVSGCASLGSVGNKMVNNTDKSVVIYGFGGVANDATAKSLCKAINNKDYRCINAEDYDVVFVYSKFGYVDGAVGINALVKKDFPNIDALKKGLNAGSKNMPFVKAKVILGQLGELVEIVSTNGDGNFTGLAFLV